MTSVSDVYGDSKYLKASDLSDDSSIRVMIEGARVEKFGFGPDQTPKIVITISDGNSFVKELPLNATNARKLGKDLGNDYTQWPGEFVDIWAEEVTFQGRPTLGARIAKAAMAESEAQAPQQSTAIQLPAARLKNDSNLDDDIPF